MNSAAQSFPVSNQLLLCVAADWTGTAGRLLRFVRSGSANGWQPVGLPVAVMLGRSGLAWGRGLHSRQGIGGGRQKREGDGCAPAGIFAITALFGYAAPDSAFGRAAKLP